jgi:2-polyprenyl-3-methyl-5-hydroxy-6-metoxy-1,4-benzoquinol methylase
MSLFVGTSATISVVPRIDKSATCSDQLMGMMNDMAPLNIIKTWINSVGLIYGQMLSKREYNAQQFIGINERPVEYEFVFRHLTKKCPTTVLDVGTGITALPALMRNCGFLVTSIDNISDYWPSGMINRHYHVINDDITDTRLTRTFDFVTCISVLEHIKDHAAAVTSMFSILNPGGHLILTFPYNEKNYVKNVYKLPGSSVKEEYPFITQVFSRIELTTWMDNNNGVILEQEFWKFFTGEYWTFGDIICPPIQVNKDEDHQISCVLIQKR